MQKKKKRMEINGLEDRKSIEKTNETKICLLIRSIKFISFLPV